jgi:hypothetical protein
MEAMVMAAKATNAKGTASWPYGHDGSDGRSLAAAAGAIDREHLLDRLQHLRGILPVFAQELASSRRQAASLRVENRGLLEEVRRLRAQRERSDSARG